MDFAINKLTFHILNNEIRQIRLDSYHIFYLT